MPILLLQFCTNYKQESYKAFPDKIETHKVATDDKYQLVALVNEDIGAYQKRSLKLGLLLMACGLNDGVREEQLRSWKLSTFIYRIPSNQQYRLHGTMYTPFGYQIAKMNCLFLTLLAASIDIHHLHLHGILEINNKGME
jgi:hypothetical protein